MSGIVAAAEHLRWIQGHEERPAKVRRRVAGVIALLAGIALLALALAGPRSDARDIEDVVDGLVSALRVDDDADYPDARRERVDRLLEPVAGDVSIEATELLPAFSGRDALREEIVRRGGFFQQLEAKPTDLRVERTESGANATAMVKLRGQRPVRGPVALERKVSIELTRRDDRWVVTHIVVNGP